MKKIFIPLLSSILAFLTIPQTILGKDDNLFSYSHTKARECAGEWELMERLIEKNGRCQGLWLLPGFPYLRANRKLIMLSQGLTNKVARHRLLEMLRRADLQARYIELDALPQKDRDIFCKSAGIDCFTGRIRAYVARCSAIIMGDEKRNHNYTQKVMDNIKRIIEDDNGSKLRCFDDPNSLDGVFDENTISDPSKITQGINSKYLYKRIQKLKQHNPYGM